MPEVSQLRRSASAGAAENLTEESALPRLADVAENAQTNETSKFEIIFERMIEATNDQNFSCELDAAENWFQKLASAEQNAILYTFFTQVDQRQTRFFFALLQYMVQNNVCKKSKNQKLGTPQKPDLTFSSDSKLSTSSKSCLMTSFVDSGGRLRFLAKDNVINSPRQFSPETSFQMGDLKKSWSTINAGNTPAASRIVTNGELNFFPTPMESTLLKPRYWPGASLKKTVYKDKKYTARSSVGSSGSKGFVSSVDSDVSSFSSPNEFFAYDDYGRLLTLSSITTPCSERGAIPFIQRKTPMADFSTPSRQPNFLCTPTSLTDSAERLAMRTREIASQLAAENDVPGWLRSLRLHKYTSNLSNYSITEIKNMDDSELESAGISALGARRKIIKFFEQDDKEESKPYDVLENAQRQEEKENCDPAAVKIEPVIQHIERPLCQTLRESN